MADRLLGSFVWCELMTTDTAAADSFYKKVVGWSSVPFAPDGSYSVFNNPSGAGVAGLMKLPDAAKQMGAPPNWMMYVGTPNVDDTAIRIAQLGGRVLKQPEDIPNTGRFAVVQDPYGATFGIYQPAPNRPGRAGATRRRRLFVVRALHARILTARGTSTRRCLGGRRPPPWTWARWASTRCSDAAAASQRRHHEAATGRAGSVDALCAGQGCEGCGRDAQPPTAARSSMGRWKCRAATGSRKAWTRKARCSRCTR